MDEHDELTSRLRRLGTRPLDPSRQAADLAALAGVQPRARRWWSPAPKVRVAAAFLAGLLLGGTGLAAADALPDPAQHVAHTVLAQVGVDVPNPPRYHGPECGGEVKANHGAYVRDDKALAQSDCGKPVTGSRDADGRPGHGQGQGRGAAKGPCQGPPPWAGNKAMTPEEVAAAKAERAAACGTDDTDDADEADELEEVEETDRSAELDATTTTVEPTTTTSTVEATTTTESTTTTTAG